VLDVMRQRGLLDDRAPSHREGRRRSDKTL
jgi:hypothetical protein